MWCCWIRTLTFMVKKWKNKKGKEKREAVYLVLKPTNKDATLNFIWTRQKEGPQMVMESKRCGSRVPKKWKMHWSPTVFCSFKNKKSILKGSWWISLTTYNSIYGGHTPHTQKLHYFIKQVSLFIIIIIIIFTLPQTQEPAHKST